MYTKYNIWLYRSSIEDGPAMQSALFEARRYCDILISHSRHLRFEYPVIKIKDYPKSDVNELRSLQRKANKALRLFNTFLLLDILK